MEDDINLIKILRSIIKSNSIFPKQLSKDVRRNINPGFIKVFVFSKLFNLGTIIVSRSSSLNDAILLEGGANFIKVLIKYISYKSDSTIEKRKFAFSKKNKRRANISPLLKSGDIISINRNIVSFAKELLDEFTKPFIGGYAAKEEFAKF